MDDQLDLPLSQIPREPERVRLGDERAAITRKFTIRAGDEILVETIVACPKCGELVKTQAMKKVDLDAYVTVGLYPDGRVGEVFLKIGKAGGIYRVYDALCVAISIGLQYGIPLSVFVRKFEFMKFEPRGITRDNPETGVPIAKSIPDYLARWMCKRFLGYEDAPQSEGDHGLVSMIPGPLED